jgi:hypothetical protein
MKRGPAVYTAAGIMIAAKTIAITMDFFMD